MAGNKRQEQYEITNYLDWMSCLPPELQNKPLWELVIPGSHDSMSYDLDLHSPIIEPNNLKNYGRLVCVRYIVRKWGRTQEADIVQQLNAGARYFDLRIARKENDPDPTRLYFYHGLLTHSDVETVLRYIKDWAEMHPKEIVILALSHFKGFEHNTNQLHEHLINFTKDLFGSKLVPQPQGRDDIPTLKRCWDLKQNVIVSYDYHEATRLPMFWYKIRYYYGDSMDMGKVEEVLSRDLRIACRSYFYICGLNLTLPEDSGIVKYLLKPTGLGSEVRSSLPRLLRWTESHHEAHTPLNIVASDLVTEHNVIATIVRLNYTRRECEGLNKL